MNQEIIDAQADVLFPHWQLERGEYEAVCAHLGLTPKAAIHNRLNEYLLSAPFREPRPRGFSRFLARPRLTRFRVARLDLATRLIDKAHPARHVLNAVIALHECDPDGYGQMAMVPTGARLMPWLALRGAGFVLNIALTLPWLALQFLRYAALSRSRAAEDFGGKRVLVTGVARGLGLDVMLECLERGASVIGTVRTEASRLVVQSRLPPTAPLQLLVADLSTPGELVTALEKAGVESTPFAMAVLCAGVKHDGVSAMSMHQLRDTFEVNLFSAAELVAWLCRVPADAHAPKTTDTTALALVSSMGRWHGMHSSAGYNASKAALSIWGESIEMDLSRSGDRHFGVTIVEPGLFESGMTRRIGIAGLLFVPRRDIARRLIDAALAGRRVLRPPAWFALLTWGVCIAGRRVRMHLLNHAKPGSGR